MKEQGTNPVRGVAQRCVDFALGATQSASHMRSALLAIDNPAKWPLDLNAIKELHYSEKKDLFFVLTCFVAVLETERLRDLLQNGKEIFQKFEEAERQAILLSATDQSSWKTGYWKKHGKEAMEYRFGPEVVEAFDNSLLMIHLESKGDYSSSSW
ncbi:hypothetical protein [uncultured Limnobacter sp.]|uniref:hypothetical protein n=1 Tax=uncultured Limnobacter sp. TaxID=199681 RepID=UPI0030F95D63